MIESLAKLTMGALLVVATPIGQPTTELWAQWGLAGVVVSYVLWRDWQRERRMSVAIEHQQHWIRETLVGALERNAKAMERMVAWLETHAVDGGDPSQAATRRLTVSGTKRSAHADLG